MREEREKRQSPEGQDDKNGDPVKFSKYIESVWTVKNHAPPLWIERACFR